MLHTSPRPVRPRVADRAKAARGPVALMIAALALIGVLAPGTAATWSSSTALGSPVITAGATAAELTGFPALSHVYRGNNTTDTAYVQLLNAGDVAADFGTDVTLAAGSSQTLASVVRVTIWSVASSNQCTANSTPVAAWTGRWTGVPVLAGRLEPGATVAYCIRTEVDRRDLPSTAMSITPALTATLTVPGSSWRSTVTATATQSVAG